MPSGGQFDGLKCCGVKVWLEWNPPSIRLMTPEEDENLNTVIIPIPGREIEQFWRSILGKDPNNLPPLDTGP